MAQASAGEPQPAPLGVEPEQDLGDGQTDEFGVAELGATPRAQPWAEQVVDHDVQCHHEGVEIGVHEASLEIDVAFATPTLGALASVVISRQPARIRKQSSSEASLGPPSAGVS
jgi:hypothetical protein